jgi:hypothetical protein
VREVERACNQRLFNGKFSSGCGDSFHLEPFRTSDRLWPAQLLPIAERENLKSQSGNFSDDRLWRIVLKNSPVEAEGVR